MSFIVENFRNVFGDWIPEIPDQTTHEEAFEEELQRNPRYIHNPQKNPTSLLDENCLAKLVLVGGSSYLFGIALGAFMHMNHYEMGNYEQGKILKNTIRLIFTMILIF